MQRFRHTHQHKSIFFCRGRDVFATSVIAYCVCPFPYNAIVINYVVPSSPAATARQLENQYWRLLRDDCVVTYAALTSRNPANCRNEEKKQKTSTTTSFLRLHSMHFRSLVCLLKLTPPVENYAGIPSLPLSRMTITRPVAYSHNPSYSLIIFPLLLLNPFLLRSDCFNENFPYPPKPPTKQHNIDHA